MEKQNTRRGNTQKNTYQHQCHSRVSLSGIPTLDIQNGGDPRLQTSGMTPLFNKGAFTLIELLVVVLIIGILAAVAVPQYQIAVKKARFAKMRAIATSVAKSAEVYYLANGTWPHSFSTLDIEPSLTPTSNNFCVKNEEMYCCILPPQHQNNGGEILCGPMDFSFGFIYQYASSGGGRSKRRFCWEEINGKLCKSLPGARLCNSNSNVYTLNRWIYGVFSCQID